MQKSTFNPPNIFNSLQYGFSQAVEVRGGRRLLLSGQVGVDEHESTVGPGLREQTEQAFDNIARVLAEAGGRLADVVMLRIYIAEVARNQQEHISAVLLERFASQPPASVMIWRRRACSCWLMARAAGLGSGKVLILGVLLQ